MITFVPQEFQLIQQLTNEMYQTSVLRDGPMGAMVIAVRNKFLVEGPIDLAAAEQRFLLFALNDIYVTSHSSIVKTQLGLQMQILRPDTEPRVNSFISDTGMVSGKLSSTGFSGTFSTMWEVMNSVMTKLGIIILRRENDSAKNRSHQEHLSESERLGLERVLVRTNRKTGFIVLTGEHLPRT